MEKEILYDRIQTMIISSTKTPKYTAISTVKIADLFGVKHNEVEKALQELIKEGRLVKSKLEEPPHYEIYLFP